MKALLKFTLILFFCFQGTFDLLSIEIPKTPFLKNFTKKEYNGRSQNWSIIQDENDIVYFANNEGVLRYDGQLWDKIEMPNKSIVRELCYLSGDSLMIGAYAEFGMIYHNAKGEMVYESWNQKIPAEDRNFGEVWRIHKIGQEIVVQTFSHIFIFEDRLLVKTLRTKESFKYSFVLNDKVYVQIMNEGLFELENGDLKILPQGSFYKNLEIWAMLPFDKSRILIGTQFGGFYLYNGSESVAWENEANSFIRKNNLFSALTMQNGNYAFGSIQNGLIIVDKTGSILSHENTAIGLQNNTVLCIFEDTMNNLWLGLDNGIDYVSSNSNLAYVRKKGGFGTGYTAIIYANKLYAGTNQGLYYIPLNSPSKAYNSSNDFKIIEFTRGQVWRLREINGALYCGHNLGLFLIKGNTAQKLGKVSGVWDIQEIPNDKEHLLLGTYDGFHILNIKSKKTTKVSGIKESARRFVFDGNNRVLMSHGYKGIYELELNTEKKSMEVLNFYNESNSLPSNFGNEVFWFRNEINVVTENGVYKYLDGKFARIGVWDRFFEEEVWGITAIMENNDSKWWCFRNGQLNQITFLNENMFELNSKEFLPLANTFPKSFENVLKIDNESYLFGNEDGFVSYDDKNTVETKESIKVGVSAVYYKYKGENSYQRLGFKKMPHEVHLSSIAYKKHRLKIILSMPYFTDQDLVQYRFSINQGPWCKWSSGNELKLDDLREGEYIIDIQSSIDQSYVAGSTKVSFKINPPISRQWYAYVLYVLLLFTSLYLVSHLFKKRIENEKRRESLKQQRKMIEKQIQLKRNAEIAQAELIVLRNEKLNVDIRHKSKELANTTMSLINKNKVLQQFKDVLMDLKKEDVRFKENHKINNLIKKINKEIELQDNWIVFEKNFDKVHENFLQRMKEEHQELTPKDLRLAAYLRMNLSSKEIAPLLNISIRSVEISRYRLRKKMNLEHDQNLAEYLISM